MAPQSPVNRRAAQRATAARLREARQTHRPYRRVLPTAITAPSRQAQTAYATAVAEGREPMPPQGSPEARQLARMGSLAYWGKADPRFLAAFQQYFYHDKNSPQPDEDEEIDEYVEDYEEEEAEE